MQREKGWGFTGGEMGIAVFAAVKVDGVSRATVAWP